MERNRERYSKAVCCFQIVRIFFSKVQTDKMSSDFLTLKIISNQKVDHHVTQCFLEYLLNILCIENCGIFLKEVCDFLNLNFSYFKLFLKNLIQWNQSFIPLQLTPYLSFNNCDLVLKIFENICCGKK